MNCLVYRLNMFCGRKTRRLTCCTFSLLQKAFTIIAALLNKHSEGKFWCWKTKILSFIFKDFASYIQISKQYLRAIKHDDNFDKGLSTNRFCPPIADLFREGGGGGRGLVFESVLKNRIRTKPELVFTKTSIV